MAGEDENGSVSTIDVMDSTPETLMRTLSMSVCIHENGFRSLPVFLRRRER